MISLFLKGSLIGFSVALPIGPVGVLCIQESLRKGLFAGMIAGLGAALADAIYGSLACIGLSLLAPIIYQYQVLFQALGSLILCYLGLKIFKNDSNVPVPTNCSNYQRIFFSTFALTLTNPLTFLGFAAIFTTTGISPGNEDLFTTIILSLGVLIGATIWWTILSVTVTFIGKKYSIQSSPLLNRFSGIFLMICGGIYTLSIFQNIATYLLN
jgi:threonine/homoserine/homoserine lactone efflux protein